MPLHCTASGKLFLAHLPPVRRRNILAAIELSPFTPHTITSHAAMEEELAGIASAGHSLDREEFLLGLNAVAVPVKDSSGATLAALACHAPSARLSLERAKDFLPLLHRAAARLAETLPE